MASCKNCNKNKANLNLEEFRAKMARGRRYLPRDHPNRNERLPYRFSFELGGIEVRTGVKAPTTAGGEE